MRFYTDSIAESDKLFAEPREYTCRDCHSLPESEHYLKEFFTDQHFFDTQIVSASDIESFIFRQAITASQFDLLLSLAASYPRLPESLLCFSAKGQGYHGFHGRQWIGSEGNIQLSILYRPRIRIQNAQYVFLIAAANAIVQTLNELHYFTENAKIKWINDIVVNHAKIAGVLAQTQIQGEKVENVVIGVGLNIQHAPHIKSDPFVPLTTALNEHVDDRYHYSVGNILWSLIEHIHRNYHRALKGGYQDLLAYYIKHSMILGKKVEVYSDPREGAVEKISQGVVLSIQDDLTLILSGNEAPVRKGRILLVNEIED